MIERNGIESPTEASRDTRTAILRGVAGKCPACGEGRMMESYLVVNRDCPACGTALHHHRADDGPAWATILIAGHLMAPTMLVVFEVFRPRAWVMALGFSTVFVALSLFLLPRIKGAFVGLQWAKRMHGFSNDGDRADVRTGA